MAVKAKQQYYADNVTLKKEAREFGMIDELKEKLDSVERGAQVNVIEEVQENGVPLEIVDKTVNVLVPEVIDNLYTIDPNNSLSAKQGKILYDMIKNLLSRGRFLSTWNTATGLPVTNPEESPYEYKAGDYYIVGIVAAEGGTNFRPEPVEYVINVASDEQETSEVHVSDIYVYDGEKWILLINSTRELAVDDYVDYTYQSTNPVENQAIARELVKKQNIFHYIGNTAPTPQNEGDEWYDTANDKLKVWDGTQWNEVGNGDTYTAGLHISIDPNDNNKISVVEWSATASGLGLVKLGSDTVQSTSPNNVTSTTGRTYRIQANGSGQLMVNVPWTDTTYLAGTGIAISNNRVISCTVKPVTVGPTAPSTPGTGDLWYDTNKNTMFLYKNNTWTIIGPEIYPITKADYDALTPAEQGDGRFFLITDNDGTIYVDWENVQNRPMYIGTTSPANPCEGYLWYDTTNDVLKIYNGTQWNEVGGGTTYTAGNGISISNDEISIDTTVVATKTDLSSKQDTISDLVTIRSGASAGATAIQPNDNVSELTNDAGYITSSALDDYSTTTEMNNAISTATSGLATESYVDTALSSKQDTLTAGANITIAQDGTISATDTTYTAGTGIDITNGVISSTQTSAEWGNITGTLSDQTDLQNALDGKQDVLVSGTNIKTVNNTSLLGNGNIDIPSGKNDIYVGTTAPSDTSVLWLNNSSSSDRRLLYYDRGNWKPLGKTFGGHSAPSNVDEGDLWFDESNDTLKVYDASGWNAIEIVHTGGSTPYEYKKGALWIDNYDVLYYYNTDSGRTPIATLFVSNTNPKSEYSYWYDGQMWYDTANNVLKIHKGYNRLTGDDTADWYPFIQAYTAGDGITISNNTISADTNVLATKTDLSGKQDKATSGSTAPSTTPSYVGQQYIDTTADKMYVATGTSSSNDWTEVGAGSGDMLYSDFGWDTLTGASVTLALRSEITPSANFTVNKPNDLKDGQFYVLRVITGATAYTMTLGTDVTNPYSEDLTLSANTIANFTFLAKDGELELQPSTDVPSYTAGDGIDITNNEISVDVTDIIGNGLSEDANNNIIVDSTIVALKSDLSNYYTKTQTYSKTEVDNLIASVGSFEVVATLPSVDTADTKKIYLLGPIGTGADKYEEYIVTESEGVKSWTKIGETSMDLSNYVTSTQLATTLQNYATTTALATKQDTLTAGTNIQISNNVISATDTKYTAGTNISIDANNVISADTQFVVVDTLPSVSTANENKVYILGPIGTGADKYEEWIVTNPTIEDKVTVSSSSTSATISDTITITASDISITKASGAILAYYIDVYQNGSVLFGYSDGGVPSGLSDADGNPVDSITIPAGTISASDFSTITSISIKVGEHTEKTWTKIGETSVDLSQYALNSDVNTKSFTLSSLSDTTTISNAAAWKNAGKNPIIIYDGHEYVTGSYSSGASWILYSTNIDISPNSSSQNKMTISYDLGSPVGITITPESVSSESGDMLYADFNWATKTGETITLDLNSTITPSANFTVNAPATIKDGQIYILRVINGATAYTMTLGTGITNPYSTSTTLTANGVDQFVFQAIGGSLELLPDTDVDITGKQDKATSGSTAPSTTPTYVGQQYIDTANNKMYFASGTSSSSDWTEVGAGGGGNVIAMTQAEYNALTTEEKNDGKLRIITDAPTEDISVDWANIANKPIELSTQSGNTLTSLKIWVGSQTDYEALATKDASTLYFTTNVVS